MVGKNPTVEEKKPPILTASRNVRIFKQSVESERIDLDKLGWSESRNDKQIMSYVRGWFWRTYKIRIEPPLDFMIHCFVIDSLSRYQDDIKKRR